MRLQSGLVRQVQVQFLWYGTRTGANRDKSGAYLFLPGEEGSQVRPDPDPELEPQSSLNQISQSGTQCLCLFLSVAHLQLYSSSEPPLVRVSRGPIFSDITSCFRHFTHRVRLYHLDGNQRPDYHALSRADPGASKLQSFNRYLGNRPNPNPNPKSMFH